VTLAGREIVLGVTGGVAAFKAAALASLLVQSGAGVTAVLTRAAKRFVGPATFAALTGRPVATRMFDPTAHPLGPHIELAARADVVVVAPATADFLARAARGAADDLLATLVLCAECPIVVAPAMNAAMWGKPAVQRNVRQVETDGLRVVPPGSGWLSCRQQGTGRMAEPGEIAAVVAQVLSERPPRRA
jgi:phosphopantothenoylcysteine decarboxylase/phosphopantothenate--cysteine ligase